MLRPVLIIAFVGTDLSFFLSEWRGRRGWRHGRLTRILALVELNLVLVLGLFRFRYVTPETLSLCYLSAALSLLLLPVPPNKGVRLPVLSAAGLAAVPAALFLPAVCPYVLVADLLLARSTLALRRRELMELLSRGITLRKTLEQEDRATWEAAVVLPRVGPSGRSGGGLFRFALPLCLAGCTLERRFLLFRRPRPG